MRDKILSIYAVAIILGIMTGIVGSFFQMAIHYLDSLIITIIDFTINYGVSNWLISALISLVLTLIAWFLVQQFAPEASGSGVQEIEGALLHKRAIFWRRLLPVKFIAGVMAISAKLVLGREGPTIQLGGNLGAMVSDFFHLHPEKRDALIAAGAAAGLATAFNAPLAGVLFVLEEMRSQFNFSFINFKVVAICCVMATITLHFIIGAQPAIPMSVFDLPSLKSLWLFFVLGVIVGFAGLIFNVTLMASLKIVDKLSYPSRFIYLLLIGAGVGLLAYSHPLLVGGGYNIIHQSLSLSLSTSLLFFLLIMRFFTTVLCYSTGVPGGIFAPMLALGALLGTIIYSVLNTFIQDISLHPGMFAVAGMGALFSAAIRAPITGIILIVEMTQNYSLILPLMVSCLTSTTIMQLANNAPIYTQLLQRTISRATI